MIISVARLHASAIVIILLLSFINAQNNFRGNNQLLNKPVEIKEVGFNITADSPETGDSIQEMFLIGIGDNDVDVLDENINGKNGKNKQSNGVGVKNKSKMNEIQRNANTDNRFDFKNDEDFTAVANAEAATPVEGKPSNVVKARSAHRILPADGALRVYSAVPEADRKKSPPPNENKTEEIRRNRNFTDNNVSGALTNLHSRPSKLIRDECEETYGKVDRTANDYPKSDRDMETTNNERVRQGKKTNRNNGTHRSIHKSLSPFNKFNNARRGVLEKPVNNINEGYDHEYVETEKNKINRSLTMLNKTNKFTDQEDIIENDIITAQSTTNGTSETARREKMPKQPTRAEVNTEGSKANMMNADEETTSAWRGWERDGESAIRFSAPPPRQRYLLDAMRLTEGTFIFSFLRGVYSIVHPFEFPTELLRDVIWNKLSLPELLLQSIRIEVGFIIAIIMAACMSLVTPVYAICYAILNSLPKTEDSSDPERLLECDRTKSGGTKRRILLFLSQSLLLFSLATTIGMIYSNEELYKTSQVTRSALEAAIHDLDVFSATAALELKHVLAVGADETIQTINDDLNRVKILLGEPIQKTLASETGIDVTFDAVKDIITATESIISKIHVVLETTIKVSDLASSARDRLRDLQRQIDNVKRHCALRDQPLCETIDSKGVELVIQFDMLLAEKRLPSREILENLTSVAEMARKNLNAVPNSVDTQTKPVRQDIRHALEEKRESIHKSARVFDKLSRHLSATARSFQVRFDSWLRQYEDFDYWRWIIMLSATIIALLIGSVLQAALMCVCCEAVQYVVPLMKTFVVFICIYSLVIWAMAITLFVVGGHGEVFICRPLYDDPDYKVLGRLLDKPGLLYADRSSFFHTIFKDAGNVTIDVPIRDALRECKLNRPSYPTFRLDRILNMNKETEYLHWEQLSSDLKKIVVEVKDMKISTTELQGALQYTMDSSNVNFTLYRSHLNGLLTGKDLTSLADQLESIGNQMTDLSSSSRMETIASRTRRLVQTVLHPLDQMRTELVYKLTEMELQMQPYRRQINLAVSHLKTIEYYIDKQGVVIADKKTSEYVMRLVNYLEQYRNHVLDTIEASAAPCGVIFTIFDVTRSFVCRHCNDSLNGFWFSSFLCAIIWSVLTPLVLELTDSYKELQKSRRQIFPRSTSQENVIENCAFSVESQGDSWSTPGPPPPQPDNW